MDGAALHGFLPVNFPSGSSACRRPFPARAAASPGTGFGKKAASGPGDKGVAPPGEAAGPAPGGKKSKKATTSKVDRLLEAAGVPDARPVDGSEAARGRVDFAQAVTWDERAIAALPRDGDAAPKTGKAQRKSVTAGTVLDNIQIASFTPGDGGAGVSGEAGEPSGAAAVGPFYDQVVRRMQYLDARGEFSISSDRRVAPLPPPQSWDPCMGDVAQYLTDVAAVAAATHGAAQRLQGAGGADTAQLAGWLLSPHAAGRAQAMAQDQVTVAGLLALTSPPGALRVSPTAAAYVQVLAALGARDGGDCLGATAALCAHAFVQRVTGLTFGHTVVRPLVFRVATQAAHAAGQPLELVAFEAAPGKQLAWLKVDMDGVGAALQAQPEALRSFWHELADAVKRTGLLLAPLAKAK